MNLIILLAGKSQRMGIPKGLIKIDGETLIDRHIREFDGNITFVLGHEIESYKKIIADRAKIVINSDYECGQFSSILAGLKEAKEDTFLMPIDMLLPDKNIFEAIKRSKYIGIPVYQGKRGHPIFLAYNVIQKIIQKDVNCRLDFVLKEIGNIDYVEVKDKKVILNFNTVDDLKSLKLV